MELRKQRQEGKKGSGQCLLLTGRCSFLPCVCVDHLHAPAAISDFVLIHIWEPPATSTSQETQVSLC